MVTKKVRGKNVGVEFKPIKKEEIPTRGRFKEEVKKHIAKFLKLMKNEGVKAIKSEEFDDKKLAMSYYDSFSNYIQKEKLPIRVSIRQNNNGTGWNLFLMSEDK